MYLVINHGWHAVRAHFGQNPHAPLSKPMQCLATLLTFLAVVVAWVIFRADSVHTASTILKAMSGVNGVALPVNWLAKWSSFGQLLAAHGVQFTATNSLIKGITWVYIALGLVLVWFAPNTQQIMANYKPALVVPDTGTTRWLWQPSWAYLTISDIVAVFAIISISQLSEFIYFQF